MILCLCPNPSVDKYIWIEDLRPGEINRIGREKSFAGGKGVHVALGIKELGEECAILGFWGGDTGKLIKKTCEEKGIKCFGPSIEEPNRTCLTFRSNGDLDGTELIEKGPFVDSEKVDYFWTEFKRLLKKSSAIVVSGSWPPSKREIEYSEFIKAAKEYNIVTFVNCSGKQLLNIFHVKVKPYCIHINTNEGFEVLKEHSPLDILRIVSGNCDLAAITCGAEGLYLSNKNQKIVHASCHLERIISAVGCGDSLMAGLVTAYCRDLNLKKAAIFSTACGSANCLREELGVFHKEDVDTLIPKVKAIFI